MKKIQNTDFEQRSYIFSINSVSFVKSMQKAGLQNEMTILLMKQSSQVSLKILDAYDIENEIEVNKLIIESLELLKSCHFLLQNIRVNDDKLLLNEKADLQIEASFLVKDIVKYLED
jgi:hypothetical protein